MVEEDYKRDYILAEKSISIEPENVENGVENVFDNVILMEEETYIVKEGDEKNLPKLSIKAADTHFKERENLVSEV